ncbi:MAG: SDR family NAD(P)-dependent oxidoreductase [Proteobacteria bacterium]|nr:SDR family NAD(P)-dependent oxidoreductase [Pseudomonadota bacterium]
MTSTEQRSAPVASGKEGGAFGARSTAAEVVGGLDLRGKTVLLTGSNSGLGLETLRALIGRGASVIALARTAEKAAAAVAEAGGALSDARSSGAACTTLACELSEPSAVRACVEAVRALGRPIDALIANAGIMALPRLEQRHGLELQFLTNHVGHFILVTGLLDQLADDGRVVMVSSRAHRGAPPGGIAFDDLAGTRDYRPWAAYGQSKLANLLFARALASRLASSPRARRTANAIHPGVIRTNLVRHLNPLVRGVLAVAAPLILKTAAQGAATQCYVAVHPAATGVSGRYFADCREARTSRHGGDDALASRLWQVTEELVARLP